MFKFRKTSARPLKPSEAYEAAKRAVTQNITGFAKLLTREELYRQSQEADRKLARMIHAMRKRGHM